jgi:hypothetical protein
MECNSGVTKQPKGAYWQNTVTFPFGDDYHFAHDEAGKYYWFWFFLSYNSTVLFCSII